MQANIIQMEWRAVADFPAYEVSECGDVRRLNNSRRLRGFIDVDGYLRYALIDADGNKRAAIAHRLVAETFIGPAPSELHEVAHNNGSRISNHYTNLRWATRKENDDDRDIHGTRQAGAGNGNAKLTEGDVREIRRIYREIKNRERSGKISDLARNFGIHHATLIHIATGKSWAHLQ